MSTLQQQYPLSPKKNWKKIIGIIFTILYVISILRTVGISLLYGESYAALLMLIFAIIAVVALWCIYFFTKQNNFKYNTLIFFFCAMSIGLLLNIFGPNASIKGSMYLRDYNIKRVEAKIKVSHMSDEILFSSQGNPIGVRLYYSMHFPSPTNDKKFFSVTTLMSPEKDFGVRTLETMYVVDRITNPPEDLSLSGFQPGIDYSFTVDMVPYFIANYKTTKCIINPKEYAEAFQQLVQNDNRVHFKIKMPGTGYTGVTENIYSLKSFYDSAIKEGASMCKEDWGI